MINRMFKTDMERLTTFQKIRSDGVLPNTIHKQFPEYVGVLSAMLNQDPEKRPSAHDLLILPLFSNQSRRELLNSIDEKERRVVVLVELL